MSLQQSQKRSCPSMVSEYSIINEIAAKLGTYHLYKETKDLSSTESCVKKPIIPGRSRTASVHREAELLINFMSTAPISDTNEIQSGTSSTEVLRISRETERPSVISHSFSFESKKNDDSPMLVSCPQLLSVPKKSISNAADTKNTNLDGQQCSLENTFSFYCPSLSLGNNSSVSVRTAPSNSTPSYLLSRPITSNPIDVSSMDMSIIAGQLSNNIVQSFKDGINWRIRTWIKGISHKLNDRYQAERNTMIRNASYKIVNENIDSIKKSVKNSHEARLISALSKASSSIVVHDVRTTFFVLEQQSVHGQDFSEPPYKRNRHVSEESLEKNLEPYELSHSVTLDAKCSVSTSPNNKISVTFRAPGAINASFIHDCDGNSKLNSVSITLDTDAFVMSLEENTRLVVRTAAEEWIARPPVNYCTIYDTTSQETSASDGAASDVESSPKPEYPDKKFYSDRKYESYFYPPSSEVEASGSLVTPTVTVQEPKTEEVPSAVKMPPPPRHLPFENVGGNSGFRGAFLNPRRVSPTEHCSSMVSPNPPLTYMENGNAPTGTAYPLPPSLVSPYARIGESISDDKTAPTMPALHQRNAHAACR